MKKIILTVGPAGSGKTTWTEKFILENSNFININRDDFRKMVGEKYHRDSEDFVLQLTSACAVKAVSNGYNIVISDTNLNEKTRNYWLKFATTYDYDICLKLFDVDEETLIERNFNRGAKQIPLSSLLSMITSFNNQKNSGVFQKWKLI